MKFLSFSKLLKTTLISSLILFSSSIFAEKLYLYNWTEYIPNSLLQKFTKETGIEVVYSTFESNEEMYSKMKLTNGGGYDLIFPSSYYIEKMAKEGMLAKLDKTKLVNFAQITPSLLNKNFDPENQYSLPYVYGLTGIGINSAEIDPKAVTSWADLWNSKYKGKILLTADSREVFHIALLLKGFSPNTTEDKEIESAYHLLQKLIPNVQSFNSDSPDVPYVQGEVSLGMIWNGSAFRAHKENPDIQFIYPREGVIIWMDNYAIPKNAEHKEAAYKFIDFMLRPESAKEVIETMGFSMPNEGVKALLEPTDVNDLTLFPPQEQIEKGVFQEDVGDAIDIYEKYWHLLKTN
ncbi:extracellular solute-binding protein [Gallibacterium anatis]|uniref:extracellular solute-binding protein n=1 Tax=Gallibacterium anatis TaxID=750 RepID=UPI000530D12B|nr:extracellular solute-binding protein [Gallibacterium anatis]KGQ35584.1 putrescine/spermidine ABC transporter substrate-binding protein [Gallibacterium anatis]KGQ49632.1 putrescine/spermidine ABC transporter substrate-binding protein [Gallibacterium anatis]MDK9561096.1 extracellular solute-binding protein [Gallibacterium anatis]WIM84040.1 extracellular solute-binding protein [Gallibacterium anatis]WKS97312.1 extracellular solute-binding protein [Gallibacterium anatis]